MKNGYFQVGCTPTGTILKIVKPQDGGLMVEGKEITEYLTKNNVLYSAPAVNQGINEALTSPKPEHLVLLNKDQGSEIRESYILRASADKMTLTARFYPPSMKGTRLDANEFKNDLQHKGVKYGILEDVIDKFFKAPEYCTDIVVAEGLPVTQGEHARIEYYFDTDLSTKPALAEDGSVDFFNLKTFTQCTKGEVLAKLFPAVPGTPGMSVFGEPIKPFDVKKAALKYGRNITCSEDGRILTSDISGNVSLVEGKVFVSDVMEVDNVNPSTGNIECEGSVRVLGNVCENFSVKSKGTVEIKGVVEGAYIEAGENIIIARGMKGMGKGKLKAEGNIIAKFIENSDVSAAGYISTDSILHSTVQAGTEITVSGKRGFITGGKVSATNLISVKTLGSDMGADTIVEVGVDPKIKTRIAQLQKLIADNKKAIEQNEPTINSFMAKMKSGATISMDQKMYMQSVLSDQKAKKEEYEAAIEELDSYQDLLDASNAARVEVTGDVYAGTKICISDVSMVVKNPMTYCQFKKIDGDVKMVSL